MKTIFQIMMLIVVFGTGLFFEFWIFGICALCYALFFKGFELLFIGVCVDALLGTHTNGVSYNYTLIVVFELLCLAMVKPYLKFYA